MGEVWSGGDWTQLGDRDGDRGGQDSEGENAQHSSLISEHRRPIAVPVSRLVTSSPTRIGGSRKAPHSGECAYAKPNRVVCQNECLGGSAIQVLARNTEHEKTNHLTRHLVAYRLGFPRKTEH